MAYCWLCETLLTKENQSQEHIIPKALGGKRIICDFLCHPCNNATGYKWDAALVNVNKPMDFIASLREWQEAEPPWDFDLGNRANRYETVSGDETRTMYRGGGDSVTWFDGRILNVEIAAYSKAQMQRILDGMRRKYNVSREKWAEAEQREKERSEDHSIQTGIMMDMPKVTRSMVKSMLALACSKGIDREEFQEVLTHCRSDNNLHRGAFTEWEVLPMEERINLRFVAVSGSRETGALLGFTNLLGFVEWMMPLAVPYEGPPLHAIYALDAKTGQEVTVSPRMERPRAEVVAIETAGCLTEMASTVEDLPPETLEGLVAQGHLPNETEKAVYATVFCPQTPVSVQLV